MSVWIYFFFLSVKMCLNAFLCLSSSGYPDPEVVWYKDDQPIKETRHFQIDYDEEGNCSLIISEVSGDDDAKYTCKAVNNLGEAICSAELIVEVMGGEEEEEEEE